MLHWRNTGDKTCIIKISQKGLQCKAAVEAAHTFNPSTREPDRQISESEASLVCREFLDSQGYRETCLDKLKIKKKKTLWCCWGAEINSKLRGHSFKTFPLQNPSVNNLFSLENLLDTKGLLRSCSIYAINVSSVGKENEQQSWQLEILDSPQRLLPLLSLRVRAISVCIINEYALPVGIFSHFLEKLWAFLTNGLSLPVLIIKLSWQPTVIVTIF